jgi:hypothetical protein
VFTPRKKRLVRPSACGLETRRESAPSKPHLCRRLSCASSGRSDLGRGRTHVSWPPAPTNRLRLWASAARTARPCGESVLELTFQTLGRDVLLGLNFHRDVDPDPGALEGDDLHVVGHVLPVRMVVALAFFKRTFARSLTMSQAHSLIVAEVDGACCVRTKTPFWGAGGRKTGKRCGSAGQSGSHRRRWSRVRSHPRSRVFEKLERLQRRLIESSPSVARSQAGSETRCG